MTLPKPPTLRQRQAAATRGAIVAAARRLFAQHGYVDTPVAQIAEEAGVAVQTVYKSMGTKRAILMVLVEAIDEEAEVPALGAGIAAATDPTEIVRAGVKLTRQMNERCGDIIRALASAAPVDADAAAALAEGDAAIVPGPRTSPAACTSSVRCAKASPRRTPACRSACSLHGTPTTSSSSTAAQPARAAAPVCLLAERSRRTAAACAPRARSPA